MKIIKIHQYLLWDSSSKNIGFSKSHIFLETNIFEFWMLGIGWDISGGACAVRSRVTRLCSLASTASDVLATTGVHSAVQTNPKNRNPKILVTVNFNAIITVHVQK